MAKTIQEQYNQIKKGKGSKEIFLKEVKRSYPHMVVNSANFKQAEEILLNRSVITEKLAGVVTSNKSKNWFEIFNKNMDIIEEANPKNPNRFPPLHIAQTKESKADEAVKADSKKVDKSVIDTQDHNFDYEANKDNYDTLNGEEFRLGVKFEMDKVRETVSDADLGEAIEKAEKLVAKNLASDPLYYVKNAAFGIDKLGYTDEAPGLTAQSQIVALEAKINHVDEIIEKKNTRLSMVTEDENLSELADKNKIKLMQREVKDLEKRKIKMEKLYEKMAGKSYKKEEIVDEDLESSNYAGASNSDKTQQAFRNNKDQDIAEQSNQGSNENSNDGSDDNSNLNSNGITER